MYAIRSYYEFILPGSSYGPESSEEIIHQGPTNETPFRVKGSLEEWQSSIGRFGEGNSRLALALSSAFLGPLHLPFGQESGVITSYSIHYTKLYEECLRKELENGRGMKSFAIVGPKSGFAAF